METARFDLLNNDSTADANESNARLTNATDFEVPPPNLLYLFLLLLPLCTIFGNTLVVAAILTEKSLKTTTNFLLLSLAIADLNVGICVVPFYIYLLVYNLKWYLPDRLCDVFVVVDVSASTSSICHLVAISIDRFFAVVKHVEYNTPRHRRRTFLIIAAAWLFSLCLGLPLGIGLNTRPQEGVHECGILNMHFTMLGSIFAFYIPCLIMCAMYGVVFLRLHQQLHAVQLHDRPFAHGGSQLPSNKNLTPLLKSAYGDEESVRNRMFSIAIPFLRRISEGKASEQQDDDDDADASVDDELSSQDVQEIYSVLRQLENGVASPSIERIVAGDGSVANSPAKIKRGVAMRRLSSAARSITGYAEMLSNAQQPRNERKNSASLQRKASQRIKNVKDKAIDLMVKVKSKQRAAVRKETRATKLVAIVMVVFLICWLPFFTMNIVQVVIMWYFPHLWDSSMIRIFIAFTWFGYVSSCLNPIIYSLMNIRFRQAFLRLLRIPVARRQLSGLKRTNVLAHQRQAANHKQSSIANDVATLRGLTTFGNNAAAASECASALRRASCDVKSAVSLINLRLTTSPQQLLHNAVAVGEEGSRIVKSKSAMTSFNRTDSAELLTTTTTTTADGCALLSSSTSPTAKQNYVALSSAGTVDDSSDHSQLTSLDMVLSNPVATPSPIFFEHDDQRPLSSLDDEIFL